ncbi:hypothetical protein [Pelagibacterium sp. H642]|uniref:hypothetical protein n=1 Tax=Pelagibacterium sp. H642 TaxID=1881069 RepID=UPI0028162F12|nr:hypothetical protein [Pelagibacterium sp. H642]WMT92074.1 hypothetical protein NO934_07405 [Pelagibacterium sp. H642]
MKLLAALTVATTLAITAAPAQAQLLGSGNGGLLGLGNLLSVKTGHVSVLNGGILNGSNLLSGLLGSSRASNASTNVTGSGHSTAPHGGVIAGRDATVVPGSGNVVGNGNMVGNQWGSNYSYCSFSRFGW